MEFKAFSKKQSLAAGWWSRRETSGYDAIICDGAVRSGKTTAMSLGFVSWAMTTFHRQSFAICGRTVTALKRIEDRISAIDGELAAAGSRLSDPGVSADYEQVLELTGLIDSLNDEQMRLMSEWEELENRKSELEELLKI